MPFRLSHKNQEAIAPLHPEDKCSTRKRRRVPPTTTTTTTPRTPEQDEELDMLTAATLYDYGYSDVDSDLDLEEADQDHEQLKRLCLHASAIDAKLSDEVQTLKDSVHSMAEDVAKAAQTIHELRSLLTNYIEQRHQDHSN